MTVVEEICLLELYDIYVHYYPVWKSNTYPYENNISYWRGEIMLNDDNTIISVKAVTKRQLLNDCVESAKYYIYDTARRASSDT